MTSGEVKASSSVLSFVVIVKAHEAPAHVADHLLVSPSDWKRGPGRGWESRARLVETEMRRGRARTNPQMLIGASRS